MVYSNTTISVATTFSPQAQRDTNGSPDLGYHYDPLDYVFGGVAASSNITFTAGTVMGWFELPGNGGAGYGISLPNYMGVTFNGTATSPCVEARYDTVQEGGNGLWNDKGWLAGIIGAGGSSSASSASVVKASFTHFAQLANDPNNVRDYYAALVFQPVDCEFWSGNDGGCLITLYATNCLFDRSAFQQNQGESGNAVDIINSTFHGASLTLTLSTAIPVAVQNCSFDGTTFDITGYAANASYASYNYNAYTNSSNPFPFGSSEVVVTNGFNWQPSWFGNFYLPTNSPVIDKGSTTANQLGLYHFTTQTNQAVEGNSIVDIGYHYVATDAYGNPLDSNGDGIPDYIEDTNGDGLGTNWSAAPVIGTQPASQFVLQGSNATFNVTVTGTPPLSYQWWFNGTNIVAGATNASLTLVNVQTTNAGNYSVVVTNIAGSATSSNGVLGVVTSPVVLITNPPNNSVFFTSPTNLTLTAIASDTAGNISVQFFQGTNSLGIVTNTPYTLVWSNAPSGSYALTAVATDTGLTATSTVVNISIFSSNDLSLWLKADAITGLTNNAAVGTWADSGNWGNDATQNNPDQQPLYVTNVINGYPAVQFDGANNDQLTMATSPGTNNFTVFAVVSASQEENINIEDNSIYASSGTTGENYLFGGDYNLGYSGAEASVSLGNNGVSVYEYGHNEEYGDQAAPLAVYGGNVRPDFSIVTVKYVNQQPSIYLNGALLRTGLTSLRSQSIMAQSIGYGSSSGEPFDGDVAEILIFSRTLTSCEQLAVGTYLNNKYGITFNIPSSPASLKASTVSSNQINLTWVNTATNPVEFEIERKLGAGGTYQRIATEDVSFSSYFDTNLAVGTTYYYRVQSYNVAGCSSYSNETNATTSTNSVAFPVGDLNLWLKADAGVTLGANASVVDWHDQSGNIKDASQSISGNQPVCVIGAIGDRPTVRFDGTNSYLNLPGVLNGSSAEGFVVLRSTGTTGGLWRMGHTGDSLAYPDSDGDIIDDFGSGAYNPYDLGSPVQPLDQYHVYNVMAQDNDWAAWINGLLQFQATGDSYATWGGSTLGYQSFYLNGDIAEILVFDRILTTDERVAVGTYLASKYNLPQYYTVNSSIPSVPTNLLVVGVSPSQVMLQWDPIPSTVHIERKDGTNGTYSEIGAVLPNLTNFIDTISSPTTQYFYRAKAHNYFGDSSYSIEVSPPVITLCIPSTANPFIGLGSTNALILQGSDAYSTINQVTVFASYTNVPIASSTFVPWTNSWTPTVEGQYSMVAFATDGAGNSRFSASIPVTVYQDSDGDGIPDWWMMEYFGHPTGETNDNSLATDDADGNGLDNLQKYLDGFDPLDYYNGSLPNLQIVSGDDQVGSFDSFLSLPAIIQVKAGSTALTNAPLVFTVTNGAVLLAATTNDILTNTLALRTDANGHASVWIYFPMASSNLPDNTIVASAFSGTNSISIAINEFLPLAHWRFDNTNTWVGEEGQLPLLATNVVGVPDWSSNAVLVDSTSPALLSYNVMETNGNVNINCQTGSVLFYFKPDWSSVDQGGTGPGTSGRLLEMGAYNPAFTNGWWSLYLSPDGTNLFFGTSTNGGGMTNLIANTSWTSNTWYQIDLTYSPESSALFIDGQLVTNGEGVAYFPNADELTNGFRIGSDQNGTNQAGGTFDELETFASPLVGIGAPVDTYWFGIPDYQADPDGTLGTWEMEYFGHIGLDPNGDYDGDGTNNLQEFMDGTDPNKISFSFSFPNQYVDSNVLNGVITILGGVPSYEAVLVNDTNQADASWQPYTSSNVVVTLGSTDGVYDVWVGLRGLPSGATQTWQDTTLILDTNLPTISITNPADASSFNSSRVNISGNFASTSLKQITVNGMLAFVNGTNFEAVNVPLIAGTNTITAVIEDLTGDTNTSSINIIGFTNSDGSMNDPVDLQATPVAGFAPLTVTFSVQTNVPGTIQQVLYDFNGDDIADFVTNNLNSITYTYTTNGEYFPVVTIQTDVGRFCSVGGWNAVALDPSNQPVQINVQAALTQSTLASVTDPVDLKWDGTNLYVLSGSSGTITEFATNGTPIGSPFSIGIASSGFDVDAAGNIYMAVTASNQVWKFIPSGGSFVADTNFGFGGFIGDTNGMTGTTNGVFNAPFDVAVSPDGGTISVSDSGNNRIQQFSAANGAFVASFGTNGADIGQFNTPKGLTYDSAGNLYIVDSGNNRMTVAQGSVISEVTGAYGTALGQFNSPVNVNASERGVYVADAGNNRIQSFIPGIPFDASSASIRFAVAGFNQPAAVAAIETYTNEMFYVADTGNNQVILCNVPNHNLDAVQSVWNSMTTHIAAGDISGAIPYYSAASQDKYRQAFLSVGTGSTMSAFGQIGTLTPSYIDDASAEYYFTKTINGQEITFPVEFDFENGAWKIVEF
jgi:hypothetical protein